MLGIELAFGAGFGSRQSGRRSRSQRGSHRHRTFELLFGVLQHRFALFRLPVHRCAQRTRGQASLHERRRKRTAHVCIVQHTVLE